jgi:glutamate 5-kinase
MTNKTASPVLRDARRIVVKVGSSLVTNEGRGLDEVAIGEWSRQLSTLVRDGREVIMVSSGAIAEGMKRLGWTTWARWVWPRCTKASCAKTAWAVPRCC